VTCQAISSSEADFGSLHPDLRAAGLGPDQRDARQYFVRASAQAAQHPSGFVFVARLAEDFTIHDDRRIGAERETEEAR
jgi:FPC/CPF motif-containing protein YcgG